MWYLYIHYICRRLVSVSLGSLSVIHYFPWFSFFLSFFVFYPCIPSYVDRMLAIVYEKLQK